MWFFRAVALDLDGTLTQDDRLADTGMAAVRASCTLLRSEPLPPARCRPSRRKPTCGPGPGTAPASRNCWPSPARAGRAWYWTCGLPGEAKTSYLRRLPAAVAAERAEHGVPHWVITDEAHLTMLDGPASPGPGLAEPGTCTVTWQADMLPAAYRDTVDLTQHHAAALERARHQITHAIDSRYPGNAGNQDGAREEGSGQWRPCR